MMGDQRMKGNGLDPRKTPRYELAGNGEFRIEHYNQAKPFSSFFPGIAGKTGLPMWVFYVNRGQCLCSMGIQDKDHPILEFLPANWAYQLAPSQGFRTFLRWSRQGTAHFYEPFQDHLRDEMPERVQNMHISASHLVLTEENPLLGLRFRVEYHTIPEDDYAGLIRQVEITNTGTAAISLAGLDGLPLIIPYGIDNFGLKNIRRLMEAFVEVANHDRKAPLFKAKVEPADRPDVLRLQAGNFYIGFEHAGHDLRVLDPIVDPQKIFGKHKDYAYPAAFLGSDFQTLGQDQAFENHYPAAMSAFQRELGTGETLRLSSIIGQVDSRETLNAMLPRISSQAYLDSRMSRDGEIIEELMQHNLTLSAEPRFDRYVRHNFLDNVLRGGFPYTLQGERSRSVLHLYSRKHGDLERDYNAYRITPTVFSQGNGNFRDINQNRRSDLFFNPDVGTRNLEHFFNLLQLDGFNPLVVKELRFQVTDRKAADELLKEWVAPGKLTDVLEFVAGIWSPGEFFAFLKGKRVDVGDRAEKLLGDLLAIARTRYESEHGEGYWSDHWTYNMDLLENYLAIYPDRLRELLFDEKKYTFHDSPYHVLPRDDKYVVWEERLMQLDAVMLDQEQAARIKLRDWEPDLIRTEKGEGQVYHTSLFVKIFSILMNKLASLDPSGMGVEMETDKPNWYDALNGLPGLMGSSLSETLEIKRNLQFLLKVLGEPDSHPATVDIYSELSQFYASLSDIFRKAPSAFEYWQLSNNCKEEYREAVRRGIKGDEEPLDLKELAAVLDLALERLETGIENAWDPEHLIPSTYFLHEVMEHELIFSRDARGRQVPKRNGRGLECFRVKAFRCHTLPHFLEGPVHFLRTRPPQEIARSLAREIRGSDLFDPELAMYKVNAPLTDEAMEIGRARVFSPGWFENESIWLHMEYKYMLELLRNGLFREFYQDFKNVFVPFMDPGTYGRSVLENSSFIVSSANPDPDLHGTGFVARLSGATAEFIHILQLMSIGETPFILDPAGRLRFRLKPALPAWLFKREASTLEIIRRGGELKVDIPADSFSFMFLGRILVTYLNPVRKDTFGTDAVEPIRYIFFPPEGEAQVAPGGDVEEVLAQQVRARGFRRIMVELG